MILKMLLKKVKDIVQGKSGRRSSKWPKMRREHLEKFPKCAACGKSEKLEVHHIVPVHVDASKELDGTNLITLCEGKSLNCHLVIGHLCSFQSWNVDVAVDADTLLKKLEGRPKK